MNYLTEVKAKVCHRLAVWRRTWSNGVTSRRAVTSSVTVHAARWKCFRRHTVTPGSTSYAPWRHCIATVATRWRIYGTRPRTRSRPTSLGSVVTSSATRRRESRDHSVRRSISVDQFCVGFLHAPKASKYATNAMNARKVRNKRNWRKRRNGQNARIVSK